MSQFKKHPTAIFIEVIVREGSGAKIEKKFSHNDDKEKIKIVGWLRDKYNFDLTDIKVPRKDWLDIESEGFLEF